MLRSSRLCSQNMGTSKAFISFKRKVSILTLSHFPLTSFPFLEGGTRVALVSYQDIVQANNACVLDKKPFGKWVAFISPTIADKEKVVTTSANKGLSWWGRTEGELAVIFCCFFLWKCFFFLTLPSHGDSLSWCFLTLTPMWQRRWSKFACLPTV